MSWSPRNPQLNIQVIPKFLNSANAHKTTVLITQLWGELSAKVVLYGRQHAGWEFYNLNASNRQLVNTVIIEGFTVTLVGWSF